MPQERSHELRNIPVSSSKNSHSWETWKRSAGSRRQRRKASNKNSHTPCGAVLFANSYHYKFPYASKEPSRVLKNRGQSAGTASGAIRLPRLHRIDAIRFDGMIVYPMRWLRRLGNQWLKKFLWLVFSSWQWIVFVIFLCRRKNLIQSRNQEIIADE